MNNENHLIMEVPKVDTKYKDKLFRMIFQEKKELLRMYQTRHFKRFFIQIQSGGDSNEHL